MSYCTELSKNIAIGYDSTKIAINMLSTPGIDSDEFEILCKALSYTPDFIIDGMWYILVEIHDLRNDLMEIFLNMLDNFSSIDLNTEILNSIRNDFNLNFIEETTLEILMNRCGKVKPRKMCRYTQYLLHKDRIGFNLRNFAGYCRHGKYRISLSKVLKTKNAREKIVNLFHDKYIGKYLLLHKRTMKYMIGHGFIGETAWLRDMYDIKSLNNTDLKRTVMEISGTLLYTPPEESVEYLKQKILMLISLNPDVNENEKVYMDTILNFKHFDI